MKLQAPERERDGEGGQADNGSKREREMGKGGRQTMGASESGREREVSPSALPNVSHAEDGCTAKPQELL